MSITDLAAERARRNRWRAYAIPRRGGWARLERRFFLLGSSGSESIGNRNRRRGRGDARSKRRRDEAYRRAGLVYVRVGLARVAGGATDGR